MSLSILVSRTLLNQQPLQLNSTTNGLAVVSFGPGVRTMRLEHATSPVTDGSVLTNATADLQTARLTVRAYGTDTKTILDRLATVENALNQWSYTITVTMGTYTESWVCQPANHARGASGSYQADTLTGGWQDLNADIPRQPANLVY
jgi:hypothetical protein